MEIGIDVSHHQYNRGVPDFDAVKEEGHSFVIVKLTEGVDYIDPSARCMAQAVLNAGLDLSYYHFATPGGSSGKEWWDAGDEARDFLAALEGLPAPTMRVVLDFEWKKVDLSPAQRTEWACEWLEIVGSALGYKPILYSYVNYLNTYVHLPSAPLNEHPLWLAHYTSADAPAFNPAWGWAEEDFFLWQHASDGEVAGITGHVDLNRAMRDLDPLRFGQPALEYRVEEFQANSRSRAPEYTKRLNELAKEGWELVHLDMPSVATRREAQPVETRMAVLKREKE